MEMSNQGNEAVFDIAQKLSEQLTSFETQLHNLRLDYLETRRRLSNVSSQLEALNRKFAADNADQTEVRVKMKEFLETAGKVLQRYL